MAGMSTPIKVLVFAGSTRAGAWSRQLAHVAAQMARADGAEVTHIELADFELPLYNADLEALGMPVNVVRLKEIFLAHPALLLCTPEYNGSYPPLLKNTLDWISRPMPDHPEWRDGLRPFAGKVVGLLSSSPGALGGLRAQSHLAPLLSILQCWVAPKRYALSKAEEAFDPDGQLAHDPQRAGVRAVVDQVLWAARRLHGTP